MVTGIDAVRPRSFYFPGEIHDFWEAVYVYDGKATATADERVYNLDRGKLLFHKPMEFHRIWSAAGTAPRLMIISFKASGEGMKRFENRCFNLNIHEGEEFCSVVSAFKSALELSDKPSGETYAIASNYAAVMLETFLLRIFDKKEFKANEPSSDEQQYKKIVSVMNANCDKALSVTDLSKLCNMGISNMKRVFKLYSDKGIAKYFMTLKMRKAMELLDQGMTATATASALGFTDINYFYTVFHRETGLTPKEYKRSK